LEDKLGRMSF